MTDQQPHTPTTQQMMQFYLEHGGTQDEFFRWLTTHEESIREEEREDIAAAEQRGAERAFRKAQEIIAGFEHTIDEARERDDMINTGYLIQELDQEIQDLLEGVDERN